MPDPASPPVTFVIRHLARDWADLPALGEGDIDRNPRRFCGGRNSWIAQGYLRLREALECRGHRVDLSDGLPASGIAFVHRDDANDFRACANGAFRVVVRADRAPVVACDLAIAQNATALRDNERFVPLWPQPALQPRESRRGTRIRRVVYQGRTGSAPSWFGDESFLGALRHRGVAFEVRTSGWEDYRRADLVLAAREDAATILAQKPATKIYNGWHAGVPVLAMGEPAYRELRRSPLDFLEVKDAEGVLRAIDRLRGSPDLYEAMVTNGQRRAGEFGVDAVRDRWLALFDDEIVPGHALSLRGAWPHSRRGLVAMALQKAIGRGFKSRVAIERWLQRSAWAPRQILEEFGRGIGSAYVPSRAAAETTRTAFR